MIQQIATSDLSSLQLASLRALFADAWSGDEAFTPDDCDHVMGGVHLKGISYDWRSGDVW